MKNLFNYKAVIFDVDGTLYYQRSLRILMGARLLLHLMISPSRFKDIEIVRSYRNFYEEDKGVEEDISTYYYKQTANKMSLDIEYVKLVVDKWLLHVPLSYIPLCQDKTLSHIIRKLNDAGIVTIAYSDYPAVDKIAVMGLKIDHVFSATDPIINCLKPNPKGLNTILNHLSFKPSDVILIGDREEKDGHCANNIGMDYVILPKSISERARLYNSMFLDTNEAI